MKVLFLSLGFTLAVIFAAFFWSSYGVLSSGHYTKQKFWTQDNLGYKPDLRTGDQLTVMSWNIAFAHGDGSEGTNYAKKSEKEYSKHLELLAEVIIKYDVDMIIMQEVDFNADRTYGVNQAQTLAAYTKMPDTAPALTWKVKYLPFPGNIYDRYDHFGHMESGGTILSKYRLENNENYLMPNPKENSWIYNVFYPSRYIQTVETFVVNRQSKLFNLHLEAFRIKNRTKQMEQLMGLINEHKPIIVAGDFNSFDTTKVEQTVYGSDDYTGDMSFRNFQIGLPENYTEALEQDSVFLNTFPAKRPNRRLDYIFYDKNRLKLLEANVIQDLADVSDHLPVIAKFVVR